MHNGHKMSVALRITLSVVNLITTIFHILGSYLLIYQYRNGLQNSQQLFLINLAIAEGVTNLLQFLANPISDMISMSPKTALVIQECQYYIKTIRGYGFVTVYFLTMIYLTLDRLFDILLNIRYPLYWNENHTSKLLIVTWAISITTTITVSVLYHYTGSDFHKILDIYIYPTFDILFIIIAFLTYSFIFHKFKQTRVSPTQNTNGMSTSAGQNIFKVFQKSRFYIPVLLISTFIFFMAIPDLLNLFIVNINGNHDITLRITLKISWALSYLSDAIIYIWIKPSVRKLLIKKLCICPRENSIQSHLEIPVARIDHAV